MPIAVNKFITKQVPQMIHMESIIDLDMSNLPFDYVVSVYGKKNILAQRPQILEAVHQRKRKCTEAAQLYKTTVLVSRQGNSFHALQLPDKFQFIICSTVLVANFAKDDQEFLVDSGSSNQIRSPRLGLKDMSKGFEKQDCFLGKHADLGAI